MTMIVIVIDHVVPRLVSRGRLSSGVVDEDQRDLKNVSNHIIRIHREFVFQYNIHT